MEYTTQVDSIGLRVEFSNARQQRSRLKEMLSLIMSVDTFYVNSIEQKFGNGGSRIKHIVYSNSTTMATIITGSYPVGKNRNKSIYFIKILFAGLCKKRSKSDTYDTSVRTPMTVSFGQ